MSYNVVRKGKSTVLVKKFRDGSGKVKEHYICSMGVMNDREFEDFRKRCHEHLQENRIAFCMQSGRIQEVAEDIPRRKTPVGDIREPTIKKEKRVKKVKKEEPEKRVKPIWTERPWLKRGYLQREIREPEKKIEERVLTKTEIDNQIKKIERDIKFSKSVIAQKQRVRTFTKTERESLQRDITFHQSVISSGGKAILILKKQRAELRKD